MKARWLPEGFPATRYLVFVIKDEFFYGGQQAIGHDIRIDAKPPLGDGLLYRFDTRGIDYLHIL